MSLIIVLLALILLTLMFGPTPVLWWLGIVLGGFLAVHVLIAFLDAIAALPSWLAKEWKLWRR